MNPNLPMRNGGANDVFQATMQGLCSLTQFVKHFMLNKLRKGPISDKVEKVVKSLYRDEVEYTLETACV